MKTITKKENASQDACFGEPRYTVTIVERSDGTVVLKLPQWKPPVGLFGGKPSGGGRKQIDYSQPMTRQAYARTLNRYYDKLLCLDLDEKNCMSVTLTLADEKYNTYAKIIKEYKKFKQKMDRYAWKHGKNTVKEVRAIEVQKNTLHYHVHAVFVFEHLPPAIDEETLTEMWGLGSTHIAEVVYDADGLFNYLTQQKVASFDFNKAGYTRFPKGANIISMSRGLPKAVVRKVDMSLRQICDTLNTALDDGTGKLMTKSHKYKDAITGELKEAIDRRYLFIGKGVSS